LAPVRSGGGAFFAKGVGRGGAFLSLPQPLLLGRFHGIAGALPAEDATRVAVHVL
jgi:hypothetical protein